MADIITMLLVGTVCIVFVQRMFPGQHRRSPIPTGISALIAGAVLLALTTIKQEDLDGFPLLLPIMSFTGLLLTFVAAPACFLTALVRFIRTSRTEPPL